MCTLEPNISQLHCVTIACIKIKLGLANVRFLLKLKGHANIFGKSLFSLRPGLHASLNNLKVI